MGLGVCNICGGLHYTSGCEYKPKKSKPINPILPKLEEILKLLKSKTHLNLEIGFYTVGAIHLRIVDNFGNPLGCYSELICEKGQDVFELAIQKIKEL